MSCLLKDPPPRKIIRNVRTGKFIYGESINLEQFEFNKRQLFVGTTKDIKHLYGLTREEIIKYNPNQPIKLTKNEMIEAIADHFNFMKHTTNLASI